MRPLAIALAVAVSLTAYSAAATPTADARNNSKSAARLATTITTSPSNALRVAAVRRALALGGVPVVGRSGKAVLRPSRPISHFRVTPLIAAHMAVEAGRRRSAGRLTLAELARGFRDARVWARPSVRVARRFQRLLAASVRHARRHPRDRLGFTPLFLARLAKRQRPSINLARANYAPAAWRLTALELELLAAFFDRVVARRIVREPRDARPAQTSDCTDFKEHLDKLAFNTGSLGGAAAAKGLSEYFDFVERYIAVLHDKDSPRFIGKFFTLWQTAVKVTDAVALYSATNLHVQSTAPEGKTKPIVGRVDPERDQVGFYATVGMSDEDWTNYLAALAKSQNELDHWLSLRNCLASVGVPLFALAPSYGALYSEIDKWTVRWTLEEEPRSPFADRTHLLAWARFGGGGPFDNPPLLIEGGGATAGSIRFPFTVHGHRGENLIRADVLSESAEVARTGRLKTGYATARAEILTTGLPLDAFDAALVDSISQLFADKFSPWGLGGTLADLSVDWFKTMFPPRAYATVPIRYHEPSCPPRATRAGASQDRCEDDDESPPPAAPRWKATVTLSVTIRSSHEACDHTQPYATVESVSTREGTASSEVQEDDDVFWMSGAGRYTYFERTRDGQTYTFDRTLPMDRTLEVGGSDGRLIVTYDVLRGEGDLAAMRKGLAVAVPLSYSDQDRSGCVVTDKEGHGTAELTPVRR